MHDLALLLALHLASMLTPGLNTGAVIANTLAGGRAAGFRTAGWLAVGAFTLSAASVLALAGLLLNAAVSTAMLALSLGVIAWFGVRIVRRLATVTRRGVAADVYPGRDLLAIYILNPQSIVFFTVLIFSTDIVFTPVNSAVVILLLTVNTFVYYALVARFGELLLRRLQGRTLEIVTNGLLLLFLAILFYRNSIDLLARLS